MRGVDVNVLDFEIEVLQPLAHVALPFTHLVRYRSQSRRLDETESARSAAGHPSQTLEFRGQCGPDRRLVCRQTLPDSREVPDHDILAWPELTPDVSVKSDAGPNDEH